MSIWGVGALVAVGACGFLVGFVVCLALFWKDIVQAHGRD